MRAQRFNLVATATVVAVAAVALGCGKDSGGEVLRTAGGGGAAGDAPRASGEISTPDAGGEGGAAPAAPDDSPAAGASSEGMGGAAGSESLPPDTSAPGTTPMPAVSESRPDECVACDAGVPAAGGTPSVEPCAETTCEADAGEPSVGECTPGTYGAGDGECAPCGAGTYSNEINAESCLAWTECTWEMGGTAVPGTNTSDAQCGTPSDYRQFGTPETDNARAVDVDGSGSVIVVGQTTGDLEVSSTSSVAAFVRKFDASGTHQWTQQFGNQFADSAAAVATDADDNIYVVSQTVDFGGWQTADVVLNKYATDGSLLWSEGFGTDEAENPLGVAVTVDGFVYVAGATEGILGSEAAGYDDAFLRKYDAAGNVEWTVQYGTEAVDVVNGVAVDAAGNIYGAGQTAGELGGELLGDSDAFLRKTLPNGDTEWTHQFGSDSWDYATAVALDDSGNVYVVGVTDGALDEESETTSDAFVRKYDPDGVLQWTQEFATAGQDFAMAIAADGAGTLHVAGYTDGAFEGTTNAGSFDAFVLRFDTSGALQSTEQFGTAAYDGINDAALHGVGGLYVVGFTDGGFVDANGGYGDAFVKRLAQ